MSAITALVNGRIMGEHGLRDGLAVLLQDGRILAVCPPHDTRLAHAQIHDLQDRLLLPGFIDVQVNGGGGLQLCIAEIDQG